MKKIVIPTDFSENAWNAIEYASKLFKDIECTFFLLHVYTPAIFSSIEGVPANTGMEDASMVFSLNKLKQLESRIKKELPALKHHFVNKVSANSLTDEVKEIVQKEKIDFVIMGTKGSTGAASVFMGSNAVRVIKTVKNCPVLVVPEGSDFIVPSEIAFSTDFKRFYSYNELQPLIDFAALFDATIRIVYVQEQDEPLTKEQQFNVNMLEKYLADVKHYHHTINKGDSVADSIKDFTEELNIYLLAMLYYKHSFVERLTREPIVKRIAFQIKIPFLTIPELGMSSAFSRKTTRVSEVDKV
ncbi:universal stress protein [Aquimarina gracilis]|uniref:Universal stress protein n=1 Tax=Aquimarina gracilis TaxID=874422 RepID=A0ABU5ZTC1_9FLAO|nr:universal stress protein [Aquimarina gracilis]MEB3345036.1 universal stress protein [Aquimarina gracilis]